MDFENVTDRILENDKLPICSDGLNGELEDDEIEKYFGSLIVILKFVAVAKKGIAQIIFQW